MTLRGREAATPAASDRLALALAELVAALRAELVVAAEPAGPDRLYSIPEAAERLSIGRTLVYDLIGRGELRVIRAGRRVLVAASAIDAYIAQRAAR